MKRWNDSFGPACKWVYGLMAKGAPYECTMDEALQGAKALMKPLIPLILVTGQGIKVLCGECGTGGICGPLVSRWMALLIPWY